MENDIRSIMELLQKGIITPEEAEKMINEIQRNKDTSRKATETARDIGGKIGGVIDDFVPMTRKALKSIFQATADVSQKMAEKMGSDNGESKKGFDDSYFSNGYESDFESDYETKSTSDTNESKESVVVESKESVVVESKESVVVESKESIVVENINNVVNTTEEYDEEHYNDVGKINSSLFEEPTENEHMIEIEKL